MTYQNAHAPCSNLIILNNNKAQLDKRQTISLYHHVQDDFEV